MKLHNWTHRSEQKLATLPVKWSDCVTLRERSTSPPNNVESECECTTKNYLEPFPHGLRRCHYCTIQWGPNMAQNSYISLIPYVLLIIMKRFAVYVSPFFFGSRTSTYLFMTTIHKSTSNMNRSIYTPLTWLFRYLYLIIIVWKQV